MITTHDDLPHPVPPIAYLRYKENWFFIVLDIRNHVYGMAHFNFEPGLDRARVSCNLMVRGELFKYGNQIPFPKQFALSRRIGDDKLGMEFLEPHARMNLTLASSDVGLDLAFQAHAPTFDYAAYDAANPEKVSAQELVNFATNQMFHHQQQAMTVSGKIEIRSAGASIRVDGIGYRDHSRGMRCDQMTLRHVWSFLHFPKTVIGAMSIMNVMRPTLTANSGYVFDTSGMRSLGNMDIVRSGEAPGGMPSVVDFNLQDVYGEPLTVSADIAGRMGHVPLVVEAATHGGFNYTIVENFVPLYLKETRERGYGLVEIGYQG